MKLEENEEGLPLISGGAKKANNYEGFCRFLTKERIKSALFVIVFIVVGAFSTILKTILIVSTGCCIVCAKQRMATGA